MDAMPAQDAADQRLVALVRESPFPVFVVRLSDSRFLEVSDSLVEFAGRSRADLLDANLLDYVVDPEVARHSMSLLAEGKIDGYTRRAAYQRPDGESVRVDVRFSAYADECPRTRAIATLLATPDEDAAAQLRTFRDADDNFVLGTVDSHWNIDRITSDVARLLDVPPEALLGTSALSAVHPEDVPLVLLLAAHATEAPGGSTGRIRLRAAGGGWALCRLSLLPLAGDAPASFAFAVSPASADRQPAVRTRELEDHLRRIAREVAASGVAAWANHMPTAAELPELSRLSSREYEIVVRLAAGDRVPGIARSLFLSESTVRNHLTSVYRKFSVRSQTELLTRLRMVEQLG